MRTTTRFRRVAVTAAIALAVTAGACSDGDDAGGQADGAASAPDLQLASSLRPLETCDGFATWLQDEVAPRVTEYGFGGGPITIELSEASRSSVGGDAAAAAEAAPMAGAPDAQPAPSGDDGGYSGTNVQVEGVDEPDIVKTDGERILALGGGRLRLVSVAEGREVAALDLPPDLGFTDLLLVGDRALVIGTSWSAVPFDAPTEPGGSADEPSERLIAPSIASTVLAEVDLSGDALTLGDTFALDGSYVSARMTDDVARLVVRSSPADQLPFVTPANPTDGAVAAARDHNRQVVEQATPEDLLPRWHRLDGQGGVSEEGPMLGCEGVHAPNTFSGFALVTVASIDLGDGLAPGVTATDGTGVLASGDTVYASPEHLYVAAPEWIDAEPFAPGGPDVPVSDVAPQPVEVGTDVHRFDITDPTRAVYDLSGRVDGSLLGQFALDEHDGDLRVATTTGFSWAGGGDVAPESESHVTVLAPGDGALEAVGRVSGLGPGEDIFAVRFFGDVGYVVTFERTDPLYTIDLSDSAAPQVTGELEIPGYSAYLHPVGDGKLLGVGQDATTDGTTTGTQVSLFDVSDPAAPTRLTQVTFPDATSAAESDHRAFLWWADSGLAAIPLSACGTDPFDGLVGLTVDGDAGTITERGRVSHGGDPCGFGIARPMPLPEPLPIEPGAGGGTDPSTGSSSPSAPAIAPEEVPPADDWAMPTPVLRSLVIGDRLWTLSDTGMAHSDLATLSDTVLVPFSSPLGGLMQPHR